MALLKQSGAEAVVRGLAVMTTLTRPDIGIVTLGEFEDAWLDSNEVLEPQRQRWLNQAGGDR
ncbi:hypothetical protein [Ferrimonas kyonanensis]|uniref:hypothetical protein n=1 Tax=Ferrimonas kyonanensis TaxID=364763 RepID=UPI000483629B|nr:hypothetical protein [Ferrimonas kyonanensis]